MLPSLPSRNAPRGTLRPQAVAELPPLRAVRLLDQIRERCGLVHYSLQTERAYVYWARAFIRFHGIKHPAEMGGPEVEVFLTHLAAERKLSPSSHRRALSALLFLNGNVLGQQLPWMQDIGRPVPKPRLPVVLSREEVQAILAQMSGAHRLLAELLYGRGMRISEALGLRVKDVDFGHRVIYVREGKGRKDRVVMLPQSLLAALRAHLGACREVWQGDVDEGRAGVAMPDALERKYPRAGASWGWFWVFPQDHHSTDPRSGVVRRHHLYDETFQRAFKRAVRGAGITKPATPHTLRKRAVNTS